MLGRSFNGFCTALSKFEGNIFIMVAVDRLKKYAHFFSLSHPFKESIVAATFMETIQKLYGVPKFNGSGKDPIFTRNFWIELFSCLGTQLGHNSSYHPQFDGKTKIVNKCLEGYLRCFAYYKQTQSLKWLHLEKWWYNTSILHQKCHHFWKFMDIILHPSHLP
jgi:hypothetical protein